MRNVLMVVVLMLALSACPKRETPGGSTSTANETIAPAASQPADNGTDAMTQTVELQDGRPEAEGGALTTPNPDVRTGSPAVPPATGTTATTATTGTTSTTATR
ncbi:MAG TPA: hypothetical protein VGF69_07660 [Thermoanaerobaculia bacterium]|jgi:hypothetical protein